MKIPYEPLLFHVQGRQGAPFFSGIKVLVSCAGFTAWPEGAELHSPLHHLGLERSRIFVGGNRFLGPGRRFLLAAAAARGHRRGEARQGVAGRPEPRFTLARTLAFGMSTHCYSQL